MPHSRNSVWKPLLLWLIFSFSFFSLQVHAQSLENRLAAEQCECFEHIDFVNKPVPMIMDEFGKCLVAVLEKHRSEIEMMLANVDSSDYYAGYQMGNPAAPRIIRKMVFQCDRYFHFSDTSRWATLPKLSKQQLEQQVESIGESINSGHIDPEVYFSRGVTYFQLEEFDHADVDFRTAMKLNEDFAPAYRFIGWIKEIQEDFDGARIYYERYVQLSNASDMEVFFYILDRKRQEQREGRR